MANKIATLTPTEAKLRGLTRLQEDARTLRVELNYTPISMTDATVLYYGTSGRGCPKAVSRIELMAKLQLGIKVVHRGRTRWVSRVDVPEGKNPHVVALVKLIKSQA